MVELEANDLLWGYRGGTVPMTAPTDTSEASIATRRYVADLHGQIKADPQDVQALRAIGFVLVDASAGSLT